MANPAKDRNLRIVFGVTLMVVLGVSSVVPVLPETADALGVDDEAVGWLVAAFTLPGMALTPLMGILADRLGRKRVLVPSLFFFALFGTGCAFAQSFAQLVALRFLQGCGAASLGVMANTLLGDLYQGPDLSRATGYNAGVLSIGTAIYPALGGALGLLGWRYPYALPLLAVPLGLVVAFRLRLPDTRDRQPLTVYLRAALGAMNTATVLGIFLSTFVTFTLLYGPVITFLPLLLDQRFAASPLAIGLVVSSASLFTGLASSQLGRLSRHLPEHVLLKAGFVLYAGAFAWIPLVDSIPGFLGPVTLFGLAQGLNIPSAMTLLNSIAPGRYRAAFMAANATVLRTGQTVGPLAMGLVFALGGFPLVYGVGAGLALCMLAAAMVMIRGAVARSQA